MEMLVEDDGTFPRVSELSMRLEKDKGLEESRQRLKDAEAKQKQQTLEREQEQTRKREALLNPVSKSKSNFSRNLGKKSTTLMVNRKDQNDAFSGIMDEIRAPLA